MVSGFMSELSDLILQQFCNLFRPRQLALKLRGELTYNPVCSNSDRCCGRLKGIFNYSTVLLLTQNNAYGSMFIILTYLLVKSRQIKLHLTYKFWLKLTDFKFDCNKTTKPAVKEKKVNKILLITHFKPELAA